MTQPDIDSRPFVWNPWLMAAARGTETAVIADSSVTWSDLVRDADLLGAGLAETGIPDGAVISATVPPGPEFFALALACLRYGYGLFPGSDALLVGEYGTALRAEADVVLHIRPDDSAKPVETATVTYDEVLALGTRHGTRDPADRAGFLIFATSGTTGDPVAVVRARPWYPYKGVAVNDRYAAGPDAGAHLMANPTFHAGTVGPALHALQGGSTIVIPRDVTVEAIGDLIDRHQADSVFLSNDQLIEITVRGTWPWRRPRVVLHGGSACPPSAKRAFIDLVGPVLYEFYGTTVCMISEISSEEWLSHPGSVGKPISGVKVRIQRGGETVPAGETGEITVVPRAVDRVADGSVDAGGMLGTGDLGCFDADGYLYVIGRMTGGESEDAVHLEFAVRRLTGVSDVAVLPVTGTQAEVDCLVEVLPGEYGELGQRIGEEAAARRLHVRGLDIRPMGGHPRTRSGKLLRTPGSRSSDASS